MSFRHSVERMLRRSMDSVEECLKNILEYEQSFREDWYPEVLDMENGACDIDFHQFIHLFNTENIDKIDTITNAWSPKLHDFFINIKNIKNTAHDPSQWDEYLQRINIVKYAKLILKVASAILLGDAKWISEKIEIMNNRTKIMTSEWNARTIKLYEIYMQGIGDTEAENSCSLEQELSNLWIGFGRRD